MQRLIATKPQELAYRAAGDPAHCEGQNKSPFQLTDKQLAEVRRRADTREMLLTLDELDNPLRRFGV